MRDPKGKQDVKVRVEAVNILTSVFACGRSALDEVLDDQGIIQVPLQIHADDIGDDEEEDDSEYEEEKDQEPEPNQDETPLQLGPASSRQRVSVAHSSVVESVPSSEIPEANQSDAETLIETISRQSHMSHRPQRGIANAHSHLLHPHPLPPSVPSSPPGPRHSPVRPGVHHAAEDAQYLAHLNRLIAAARRDPFPSQGAFDMSILLDALPDGMGADELVSFDGLDVLSRFRSANQLERDKKVGAAGELYVSACLFHSARLAH